MSEGEAEALTSGLLDAPGITHAFFTRRGGVSAGFYATLNGGVGSRDEPGAVAENRARMAAAIGVAPECLLVSYQVHSPDALIVDEPWPPAERPRCDALATATRGLGLGVTGADCGVLLFADAEAGVIGAAHAGWKGALTGIIEATVAAMARLGAKRGRIAAALGPTIRQDSYEVGPEFLARFLDADAAYARFFKESARSGRAMFDLPGFIAARVAQAEIGRFEDLKLDTYADDERFFSYRRATHRGEADYGRLVAAIALR
ncbi:MAG TPA: polyphenol oxidase family protein [Roseiarcus sp.]|nr:polyphenol oxidase family protein [Roseiarcus sp.]